MKKLSICFITEDFYPEFIGGQGVYGYHLVDRLSKMGHKVTVLAEKRGEGKDFWKGIKNVKLIEVPFCFGNKLILAILEYLYFLIFCGRENFDITHLNGLSGLLFTIFKPENAGKIIVMDHNTNFEMNKETNSRVKKMIYPSLIFLERIIFERADGILFNNPGEQANLKKYYPNSQKHTKAVYLGFEKVKFTSSERDEARISLRKRLNWPGNAKIVLYLGRMVERKKVDKILEALKILGKSDKSIYAVVVGDGPGRKRLEAISPGNVSFLGWDTDTKKYYLASNCFVTVSVAEGGFLITALEAASFGLPLILSKSAAGFPIVREGENGYVFDSEDTKLLADKIKRVLNNSYEMGKVSRSIVRQFSWDRCTRETVKFYQSLVLPVWKKSST